MVIVDDLVQSGGTLIECQKLLASQVRSPPFNPFTHYAGLPKCVVSLSCIVTASDLSHGCCLQGAAHVSAYVTHGVFPNQTWQRFTAEGSDGATDGFRYFWITDSCANTALALADRAPFEVLSLAEPIAAALQI